MAKKCLFWIGHGLTARGLTDQALAVFGERDHGRRCTRAFGVLDDAGLSALHDSDARIRGAKVNTDYFAHIFTLSTFWQGGVRGP